MPSPSLAPIVLLVLATGLLSCTNSRSLKPRDQQSTPPGTETAPPANPGTLPPGTPGYNPDDTPGGGNPGDGGGGFLPDLPGNPNDPSSGDSVAPGLLPCDVEAVVVKHCHNCHGKVPKFGGGMSLVTVADWKAAALTDPAESVYHLAKERMNYDSSGLNLLHTPVGPMPPAPNERLNEAELKIMNQWIDGGLADRPASCNATPPGTPGDDTAETPPPPSTAPTEPDDDSGNDFSAYDCEDIGGKEIRFVAHADRQKDVPFKVGKAKDAYFNFGFKAPWNKTVYAKIIDTVIDNDEVLHHWLFYKGDNSAGGDGRVATSLGAHTTGELVNGWAPGGEAHYYGEDLGRALEPGMYNLEVHYNSNDASAVDMSGISICYVEEKPKNVAELVWLGSDQLLPAKTWTGNCEPRDQKEPIHIVSVTPHMHVQGRHIKAVINRKDGSKDILHDKPFNFDSQVTWNFENDIIIYPGDTITTTCTYAKATRFGKATEDEMCYLYATTWPVGKLRSRGLGALIHGPNSCM